MNTGSTGKYGIPRNENGNQIKCPEEKQPPHLNEIFPTPVLGQELQLLGVDGASPLLSDQLYRVL